MNREELIAYDKWLTRRKWGTGEIISPEKAADIYLAEHPLPPAEGAENVTEDMYEKVEAFLQSKDIWNHPYISDRENKTGYEVTFLIAEFATLQNKPQPIAEKMVAENLVEFGNMIRDEPNGDIAALAEYFIRTINLKTREK